MNSSLLSNELRRFINTIASIPHLEIMLLLQQTPSEEWAVKAMAQRMYVGEAQAAAMLKDLENAGICKPVANQEATYIYSPAFPELAQLINELAEYYPRNLIQVTNMIHAKSASGQRVKMFADAFKFLKDK
jgi:predicted transcriptional regulator